MAESEMRQNDSLSQVLITEADTELVRNVHCKMHALPQLSNMSPTNTYSVRARDVEENKKRGKRATLGSEFKQHSTNRVAIR